MPLMKRFAPAALLALLSLPAIVRAEIDSYLIDCHDAARDRDVPAKIYRPKTIDSTAPLVIFSPGLGGSREGYSFYGKAWAEHGYVVAVLEHVGSNGKTVIGKGQDAINTAMGAQEYAERVADVKFAIDQINAINADKTDALFGKIDLKHIAMAGHSYGAVTTQAIVGQQMIPGRSIGDPRISCGIIMSGSPPRSPLAKHNSFEKITLPLLHLTGTEDDSPVGGITAKVRRVPFDQCPSSPQTLITFNGADHAEFAGRTRLVGQKKKLDEAIHPVLLEVTTQFLDAHLRNDAKAAEWMKTKVKAEVGNLGVVEQK
ncbi:MAG: hypothetical protein QM754_21510 [Tepidisphaeraceae bacterium]